MASPEGSVLAGPCAIQTLSYVDSAHSPMDQTIENRIQMVERYSYGHLQRLCDLD